MHLKSLEVVGFKSFADPTTLYFHKGVTAIVGPNGCGKSNVLDSIRWALGEQSAKALRGSAMPDVIFNGTDTRKSTGMAEVSLTFTECEGILDTEFNEVRITRRVFRDGRSEYEINKTGCRLKDIQKLFMDTGIGRSSYSIMEQGKIDQILSSKPEERRTIFEEAAGITKFKAQKKEALRKLDLTESNLLRVTDITKEVRRQIGSLQRQAAKARRYKEVYGRLRVLDTRYAKYQFDGLKDELTKREAHVGELQTQLQDLKVGLEEKERELLQKRIDLENLNQALRNLDQERARAESMVERGKQEITFNEQRITEIEGLKERNRADIVATEEKINVQEEQAKLIEQDKLKSQSEVERTQQELSGHQAALEAARAKVNEAQHTRSELDTSLVQMDERLNQGRARLNALELQQRSYVLRVEKLEEEEQSLRVRIEALQTKSVDLKQEIETRESKLAETKQQVALYDNKLAEELKAVKERRTEVDGAQSELTQVQARKSALEKLVAARTGYSETTKKLLERFQGNEITGTLFDFIQVQPGYEKAIQRCLGLAWELLVVTNTEALESVLKVLPELGQAVLAVAEDESHAQISGVVAGQHECAAGNFVQIDPKVEALVKRLLSGFLVVESAQEAKAIQQDHVNASVVSKEGEFWSERGWEIRGPVLQDDHSILVQDNELRALEDQIQVKELAVNETKEALEKAQQSVAEVERAVAEGQTARGKEEGELSALTYEWRSVSRQIEEEEHKLKALGHERVKLSEQDTSDQEQQKRLEQELEELTDTRKAKLSNLEQVNESLKMLSSEVESCLQKVTDARISFASQQQKAEVLGQQTATVVGRLEELRDSLNRRKNELEEYEQRLVQSRDTIKRAQQMIEESVVKIETHQKEIETETEKLHAAQLQHNEIEQTVKSDREKISGFQSESSREEVQVAEKRMQMNALADRIQRSYHIDLYQPEPFKEDTPEEEGEKEANSKQMDLPEEGMEDWSAIEVEINELQERVDRMGPVNVEAITEYEELEERLNFLEQQEKDLTASREQLHEAIKKINQTTKTLFSETFAKIQKNFAEMFHELFGGGKASLTLVSDDDPLESGIEIIAKPPGKQLQTISLLSGGERTMTAVALLFAIYMVKPSPFCILDEMDAPLDESNIMRFIKILQRFVHQSQFVVITHNKRTISSADVLYGVTMQEHGVSKIVSVKLSKKDEDPLFPKDEETMTIADSVRGEVDMKEEKALEQQLES